MIEPQHLHPTCESDEDRIIKYVRFIATLLLANTYICMYLYLACIIQNPLMRNSLNCLAIVHIFKNGLCDTILLFPVILLSDTST